MGASPGDKFANATELPRRAVEITKPFALGVSPVTVAEWAAFEADHDSGPAGKLPVVNVSLNDVERYLAWLNSLWTGRLWRLPTEEEWEYACRAGTETIFHTGDQLGNEEANFLFNEAIERSGPGRRTPVGTYPTNPWGLHDMHGNVVEWTSSPWKRDLHPGSAAILERYTVRGGSWDLLPRLLRSSWRDGVHRSARRDNLGFRVARDLD